MLDNICDFLNKKVNSKINNTLVFLVALVSKQILNRCMFIQKHQHIRIDGKTPPTVRQTLCDQFQHNEEYVAAALSITTANAGKWVGLYDHVTCQTLDKQASL